MKCKKVLFCMLFLLFTLFSFVFLVEKTWSVDIDNVIKLENLKEGDLVSFGTKILYGENYHFASNGGNSNAICIEYYDVLLDDKKSVEKCYYGTDFEILSYYDVFFEDEEVVAWKFVGFSSSHYFCLKLVPVFDNVDLNIDEDSNSIKANCPKDVEPSYEWFKIEKIVDYDITVSDSDLNEVVDDDDVVYSGRLETKDVGYIYELKYNFVAEKGNILHFMFRAGNSDTLNVMSYYIDGVEYSINDLFGDYICGNYCLNALKPETSLYVPIEHEIKSSGSHELRFFIKIVYDYNKYSHHYPQYTYLYVKDVMLKEKLNSGAVLDTSLIPNKCSVIGVATCGNDFLLISKPMEADVPVFDGSSPEESTPNDSKDDVADKPEIDESNPNTGDFILLFVFVLLIIYLFINRIFKMNDIFKD